MPILIGIGLIALVSVLSLTPEQRAEARARGKRLEPLWWSILFVELLVVLYGLMPRQL